MVKHCGNKQRLVLAPLKFLTHLIFEYNPGLPFIFPELGSRVEGIHVYLNYLAGDAAIPVNIFRAAGI